VVIRDVLGKASVYMSRCDDSAWLSVALEGPGPNRYGISARVDAVVTRQR